VGGYRRRSPRAPFWGLTSPAAATAKAGDGYFGLHSRGHSSRYQPRCLSNLQIEENCPTLAHSRTLIAQATVETAALVRLKQHGDVWAWPVGYCATMARPEREIGQAPCGQPTGACTSAGIGWKVGVGHRVWARIRPAATKVLCETGAAVEPRPAALAHHPTNLVICLLARTRVWACIRPATEKVRDETEAAVEPRPAALENPTTVVNDMHISELFSTIFGHFRQFWAIFGPKGTRRIRCRPYSPKGTQRIRCRPYSPKGTQRIRCRLYSPKGTQRIRCRLYSPKGTQRIRCRLYHPVFWLCRARNVLLKACLGAFRWICRG
jgi:hypothetical protein